MKNSLCEKAILSDISKGSLKKAETLLFRYIEEGRAEAVLGDGFCGVPKTTDEVLIAGMGGHEIVDILSDEKYGFLPERFVFQPMHDAEMLRRYLIGAGAFLERDFTFKDGKFYDVIAGRKRGEGERAREYSDAEYEFGRKISNPPRRVFGKDGKTAEKSFAVFVRSRAPQREPRRAFKEKTQSGRSVEE